MENLPMQSLKVCSVFSHFLTNLPGSTSSVRQLDFTTLLIEHRSSPDLALGFTSSPISPNPWPEAKESEDSSSTHFQPMLSLSRARARPPSRSLRFVFLGIFVFLSPVVISLSFVCLDGKQRYEVTKVERFMKGNWILIP